MVGPGNAKEDTVDTATKNERIRSLNDELRRYRRGGRVVMTSGIDALGPETTARIFAAVAAFDDFNGDNDPHGEHDCASMTVDDLKIIWKIDYYDNALQYASPDPTDPAQTTRVMTVMLAEEY